MKSTVLIRIVQMADTWQSSHWRARTRNRSWKQPLTVDFAGIFITSGTSWKIAGYIARNKIEWYPLIKFYQTCIFMLVKSRDVCGGVYAEIFAVSRCALSGLYCFCAFVYSQKNTPLQIKVTRTVRSSLKPLRTGFRKDVCFSNCLFLRTGKERNASLNRSRVFAWCRCFGFSTFTAKRGDGNPRAPSIIWNWYVELFQSLSQEHPNRYEDEHRRLASFSSFRACLLSVAGTQLIRRFPRCYFLFVPSLTLVLQHIVGSWDAYWRKGVLFSFTAFIFWSRDCLGTDTSKPLPTLPTWRWCAPKPSRLCVGTNSQYVRQSCGCLTCLDLTCSLAIALIPRADVQQARHASFLPFRSLGCLVILFWAVSLYSPWAWVCP